MLVFGEPKAVVRAEGSLVDPGASGHPRLMG